MLYTPNYDVRTRAFCGPTAISAVTGNPISEVRDAIRKASGREQKANGAARAIMGVATKDVVGAMALLGWRVAEERVLDDPHKRQNICRLDDFLRDRGSDGPFIVYVTGHYYAVSQGEICDTRTCLPKDIVRFKKGRNRWVLGWWKFERF